MNTYLFQRCSLFYFILVISSAAIAQPEVTTLSLEVQHVKGCVDLVYPSATGDIIRDQDRHQLEPPPAGTPPGALGGSIIGVLNAVTETISASVSRDGQRHKEADFVAAGYTETTVDGKKYRIKDFTVARRAEFKLCIKPGFNGDGVTLEARTTDYQLKQKTEPNSLSQLASPETTERVKAANNVFNAQVQAEIDRLIAEINQRVLPMEDIEFVQLWRSQGIAKQVSFTFGGSQHSTTVKLRRPVN